MKILLVAHKYPPHSLGGVEVYTRHLAQALGQRHRVLVFYRHDEPGGPHLAELDEQVDGVETRRVSLAPRGLGASVAGEFMGTFLNPAIEDSFARLLATWQPDLVHFQHVMALSARLPALSARAGVPALLTLHEYWFICGNSQLIWPDAQTCRGKALGMNEVGAAGLIATLANNIPMFGIFKDMNPRGKVLNAAFQVSAAFSLADHLGFAAANNADLIGPMLVGKLVGGILGVVVAMFFAPKD